jgi:hypothetical protein
MLPFFLQQERNLTAGADDGNTVPGMKERKSGYTGVEEKKKTR